MSNISVTLVVENVKEGCGIDTYSSNLRSSLIKEGVEVCCSGVRKILGNYPLSISRPVKTRVMHITSQRLAAILLFFRPKRCKSVVTVHDVIELINFNNVSNMSGLKSRLVHWAWSRMIIAGLRKADALIAVSDYTKKDIQRLIRPKNKVHVIYEAASAEFRPLNVGKAHNSILYVVSNLAHKNLKILFNSFAIVKKRVKDAKLILIGRGLKENKELGDEARRLGIRESIVFKGYMKHLATEYSKAGVFVFPSLYEGFGLPVLEAMACGCPVICSDKTSLPEVVGDAAIYFDGCSTEDLAKKVYRVLKDENLRRDMEKNGFEQAKKFSWEKCAEQTIGIYTDLANNE